MSEIPAIDTYQKYLSVLKGSHYSFYNFFRDMWDHVSINKGPLEDNWHIKYICDELEKVARRVMNGQPKEYDLLINVPPGSSKTTICTIIFPVWVWTQQPEMRIITGSFEGSISYLHSTLSRDLIASDFFRAMYGDEVVIRPDVDAKGLYMNTSGGYRRATSTGANVTGAHAHILVVDDPLNPKGAKSEKILAGAANWIDATLSTRKVDKRNTPTIMIMQRLHEDDPAGHWIKKRDEEGKDLKHIRLPATTEAPISPPDEVVVWNGEERTVAGWYEYGGGYLEPRRMGPKVLKDARIDLGSLEYANQYDQEPADLEGNIIKRSWLPVVPFHKLPEAVKNKVRDITVDTGDKSKADNDPTGMLAYCEHKEYLFIFDYLTVRATFPERVEAIKGFVEANGAKDGRVWIEPKSSGVAVTQYLQLYSSFSVLEWEMIKGDKAERLRSISPKIEAGRCYLIKGSWNEAFLKEVCGFPTVKHDEAVDCLTMAGINTWLRGYQQSYQHYT